MESIDLNLIPGESYPVCHVSQFDNGREIKANLFDGSSVYTLDGTETLILNVQKPDAHIISKTIANPAESYVIISTTREITACYGNVLCELRISKGSSIIGTSNFIMEVEEDPLNGGVTTVEAYSDLQQQVEDIVNNL